MRLFSIGLASVLALAPLASFAQEEEGEEAPPPPAATESAEEAEPKKPAAVATDSADQGGFKIRRGFFAEGDLGIFVTLGGTNTNSPTLNKRGTSNLQPYVGATFGYDLFSTDAFAMGLGIRLAMALNGGAGRARAEDGAVANTQSNDYSIQETGAVLSFMFLVTERLGLTLKLHGGAGFVTPDPTLPASEPESGRFVFAPVFGGQFGLELYTLLNDFSIGLQVGFLGAIAGGEFIPALSGTIPVKYTF